MAVEQEDGRTAGGARGSLPDDYGGGPAAGLLATTRPSPRGISLWTESVRGRIRVIKSFGWRQRADSR